MNVHTLSSALFALQRHSYFLLNLVKSVNELHWMPPFLHLLLAIYGRDLVAHSFCQSSCPRSCMRKAQDLRLLSYNHEYSRIPLQQLLYLISFQQSQFYPRLFLGVVGSVLLHRNRVHRTNLNQHSRLLCQLQ